jgi:hypothetical protein
MKIFYIEANYFEPILTDDVASCIHYEIIRFCGNCSTQSVSFTERQLRVKVHVGKHAIDAE